MQKELSREEIDALIDYHSSEFEKTNAEIARLTEFSFITALRMKELKEFKTSQEKYDEAVSDFKFVIEETLELVYSSQWTLVKKTEFILKNIIKRLANTREIAEVIKVKEQTRPIIENKVINVGKEINDEYIEGEGVYRQHLPIEHLIPKNEVAYMPEIDVKELVSKLGATLKQKIGIKDSPFGRIEMAGLFYYGLIDWFENGKPKKEYMK